MSPRYYYWRWHLGNKADIAFSAYFDNIVSCGNELIGLISYNRSASAKQPNILSWLHVLSFSL